LIRTELQCLPHLAPRLPVAIPVPIYAGQPSSSYPWPFLGYTFVPGARAPSLVTAMSRRLKLAAAIARFLKALHAVSPDDLPDGVIPFDTLARLDIRSRRSMTESRLDSLQTAGVNVDKKAILSIMEPAPDASDSPRAVPVHGDLHIGQLLVTPEGDLAGVIDWGDLHVGHVAVDLAIAHELVPPSLHEAFFSSYGPVDQTTWFLARARAVFQAVALLVSAVDAGDSALAAEARLSLSFIVGGDDR